ncbi:MAG: TonB-dependent receptor [Calditrichaeota bacterium]|nr:TonB-dependent receptor [Calditrichota bacterium]
MAQQVMLKGTVTDASTGEVLPGVNLMIDGSNLGAASQIGGDYFIYLKPGKYVIIAQFVGYKTDKKSVTITSGETPVLNFALEQDVLGLEGVAVIGSRRTGRTVVESPVPIDIITEAEIRATGMTQTTQILQQLIPSYNAPQPSITDGSDHMRPATLRGLGPDQVLVLINGKRRHTSALVHVNGSVGRGSTGVDLNSIPASAIEKIEVLRDGAAAQYGSDAISGVINIILKERPGFDASVTYSQYLSSVDRGYGEDEYNIAGEDATTYDWDGNGVIGAPASETYSDGKAMNLHLGYGLPVGNGNFYVSGQFRNNGYSNRAGLDPRQQYFDGDPREAGFDRLNHRYGNGEFDDISLFVNGSIPIGQSGATVYTFGGYNTRDGESGCFYRRANDNRTVRSIHPDGFLPILNNKLKDFSGAVGVKGALGAWAYDLSGVYGNNSFNYGVINSNNVTMGNSSPEEFDAGTLKFNQLTTNLDIFREIEIGAAAPLNVALGAEFRRDQYQIVAGEEASYIDDGIAILDGPNAGAAGAPGSQCFPGFTPRNERDINRTNFGGYVDLETKLSPQLLVSAAGRFENYSDFGSTVTGKFATRLEVTSQFGLRGAVSTGFRAPSLAQAYFTSIATNFINGVPFEVGTFPVDDPVAVALGAKELEAEKSLNFSAGATLATNNVSLSVDVYQIDIKDRIVLTENFTGTTIQNFLAQQGINASGGRFFTNAVETQTRGIDITGRYAVNTGQGTLKLTAALNFNETEITNKDEIQTPDELKDLTTTPLFGRVEQGRFELGQPGSKMMFAANYDVNQLSFMLRATRYGEVKDLFGDNTLAVDDDHPRDETFTAKVIADLEIGYTIMKGVGLAIGANNLLDTYPDKQLKINSFNGIFPYDGLSPFGFFGRSIYSRLTVNL